MVLFIVTKEIQGWQWWNKSSLVKTIILPIYLNCLPLVLLTHQANSSIGWTLATSAWCLCMCLLILVISETIGSTQVLEGWKFLTEEAVYGSRRADCLVDKPKSLDCGAWSDAGASYFYWMNWSTNCFWILHFQFCYVILPLSVSIVD